MKERHPIVADHSHEHAAIEHAHTRSAPDRIVIGLERQCARAGLSSSPMLAYVGSFQICH